MIRAEGFVTVAKFSLYGGREWSASASASSALSSSSGGGGGGCSSRISSSSMPSYRSFCCYNVRWLTLDFLEGWGENIKGTAYPPARPDIATGVGSNTARRHLTPRDHNYADMWQITLPTQLAGWVRHVITITRTRCDKHCSSTYAKDLFTSSFDAVNKIRRKTVTQMTMERWPAHV